MKEIIKQFPNQLNYSPEIQNSDKLKSAEEYVVMGMGGSHLPADILKTRDPYLPIRIHKNYGLPLIDQTEYENTLLIAVSHSGNTEETISFAKEAIDHNLNLAVITTGGELLEIAKENSLSYIQTPGEGLNTRHAQGYLIRALAEFIDNGLPQEIHEAAEIIKPKGWEQKGTLLARALKGRLPVIYASEKNKGLAYNWKARINENSKVPAFFNTFPEINHNEMDGFGVVPKTKEISGKLHFLFLDDPADRPEIRKRMGETSKIYKEKELPVAKIELEGQSPFEKIFNSLMFIDWTSCFLAEEYDNDPMSNELIEGFKNKMKS